MSENISFLDICILRNRIEFNFKSGEKRLEFLYMNVSLDETLCEIWKFVEEFMSWEGYGTKY